MHSYRKSKGINDIFGWGVVYTSVKSNDNSYKSGLLKEYYHINPVVNKSHT